jgi:hypothetical protein
MEIIQMKDRLDSFFRQLKRLVYVMKHILA